MPDDTLQFREHIHHKARRGEAMSEDEIGTLAQETADLGGNVPVKGPSTTEESINVEQAKWASKAYEVLGKPANEITKDEARDIQAKESIADQNEDIRFRENA
ncbi:hypothetical protein VTN00DRAFT_8919 [Thermoascus crustaceus]|uniref:uncharacterized protein n=1 Tax=Thermoascus crustaceus TaxID=5088 RepID=UPI003742BF0A